MSNERLLVTNIEIALADNILAVIINEKRSCLNEHRMLYQTMKDKYDLQKADDYTKQIGVLTSARKILLQTLEERIKGYIE